MRIAHSVFISLIAVTLAGCGTSDYDLRAYTQSDGLVGVHTIQKAKESETQAVAEAECKKKVNAARYLSSLVQPSMTAFRLPTFICVETKAF